MLSRTADHLFWMARSIERAENTARMLDVQIQTSLLPGSATSSEQSWRSMLDLSELTWAYEQRYGVIDPSNVLEFMVRDPSNLSSIYSCLRNARENARAVRGTVTTEVFETTNLTWLELQKLMANDDWKREPGKFFEWVKLRSHLARGVMIGTMLKDEPFYFLRLGTFLERADNTARILDVKYHRLESLGGSTPPPGVMAGASEGAAADYYYWAAVLRSVSGFEIYRKVYRDVITPARVAELLILRKDMPRSLLASIDELSLNLAEVRNDVSAETERRVGKLRAELQFSRIEDLLEQGLHVYLTQFMERVYDIGNRISRDFLVPLAA